VKVEMYSKEGCGYCMAAARLMMQKGIPFNVQELNVHFSREMLLEKFPDAKTFPVIVVDGMYIGGYNELNEELNRQSSSQILLNE
jgi:glutaredoxin 3